MECSRFLKVILNWFYLQIEIKFNKISKFTFFAWI